MGLRAATTERVNALGWEADACPYLGWCPANVLLNSNFTKGKPNPSAGASFILSPIWQIFIEQLPHECLINTQVLGPGDNSNLYAAVLKLSSRSTCELIPSLEWLTNCVFVRYPGIYFLLFFILYTYIITLFAYTIYKVFLKNGGDCFEHSDKLSNIYIDGQFSKTSDIMKYTYN